jgi:nucleotide-binding universal stress UspA family protein
VETVLETGSLTELARQMVQENGVDLVVVGRTETSTGWLAQLFGSQASDLLEALDVPVLMVPPEAETPVFRQILYATQLEFDERAVLRQVFDWAKTLGASVRLVKLDVPFEPNIHRDEDYLKDIKTAFAGESYEFIQREAETVSGGLSDAARDLGADLLVLTSHHRSFLDQLVNPSKARQVLLQSPVPTLVFPLERA